jgi:hypothetical protein
MKETIVTLLNKLNAKHYVLLLGSFLIPIAPLLFIVGVTIFLDTVFGIMSSLKRGIPITSHRLSAGLLSKMLKYQLIIISVFFLDYYLLSEFVQIFFDKIPFIITKLVAVSMLLTEFLSLNENIKFIWNIDIIERIGNTIGKLFDMKKQFNKFND